jgi:toxin ParE1/3/4
VKIRYTATPLHRYTATPLAEQPRLGTVPPELGELGIDRYLELAVGRNRILYEVRDETVFILIVVDHRRDFRAVLSRRLLEPPTGSPETN